VSTLVEIEAAADALPSAVLQLLYAHLGERLGRTALPPSVQRLVALDAGAAIIASVVIGRRWESSSKH
jgi:hypothetical protein